jgi:hypothetical protein
MTRGCIFETQIGQAQFFVSTSSEQGEKHAVAGVLAPHTGEGSQRVVPTIWIIYDRVMLTEPLPTEHLEIRDVGTGAHVYAGGKAFEGEFTMLDGQAAAVATMDSSGVRPVSSDPACPRSGR